MAYLGERFVLMWHFRRGLTWPMVSDLGCLEVVALFSSFPRHTYIPSEPLLPSPQHMCARTCVRVCADAHTQTYNEPTRALATTPVAPRLQLGELNLSEIQAFSPILANLGPE